MSDKNKGFMAAIVQFALRFPGVVMALAVVLTGYGVISLYNAKYDVFPEFAPPQVIIQTEAPGFSPEQVELLVTGPIESAVNGVPEVESIRSGSIQGLSVVTVTFQATGEIYRYRQLIDERLAGLSGQLPRGIVAPVITPLTSSTNILLAVGLTSAGRSLLDLRSIADWTVKPRLLAVPGVAKVVVFGSGEKQLQIQIKPNLVVKYNLALDEVLSAAKKASGILGAGFIDTESQHFVLQPKADAVTPAEVAKTVISYRNGAVVTLGDVADIVEGPEPPTGGATVMGKPGVIIMISAQYGANTPQVTDRVEAALKELHPALESQGVELHTDILRPAKFIRTAVENVKSSLLIGAMLVVAVLFLFLFNFKTAAISCTAIPLSLLAAVITMEYAGMSLNTMTLGGLAIAIGVVVDDAIIDVENITRRLRENRRRETPLPVLSVVFNASMEVRSAIVYATFAIVLVFVPVLTLPGLAGRFFAPLGVAYILAILASLLVALTATPALCLVFLGDKGSRGDEPPLTRWLKVRYVKLLLTVEQFPRLIIIVAILITAGGLATIPFFGKAFLPDFRQDHFVIHTSSIPGTSLQESLRLGRQITLELLKIPYVSTVAQRVGRAEKADDIYGTHDSEIEVDLKPLDSEQAELAEARIRKAMAQFPGVNFSVRTFLSDRIEEILSGYTAPVAVNIFGNDLDALDAKAGEIAGLLRTVRGAAEVQVQSPPGAPQIVIELRSRDVGRWGFNRAEVYDAIHLAHQGETVGQAFDGNRVFSISAMLNPKDRTINNIGSLPLRNASDTYVRLDQLADVYETSGRYVVLHSGARRVQTVTCNVAGRDMDSFVTEAKETIASKLALPLGAYIEFSGTAAAQARSQKDLLTHSSLVLICIILLLSMVMRNNRNLLLVLANLPFALVGGAFTVLALGGILSLGSMVGFVTLFGITLRNSIMMISHLEHLVTVEGLSWGIEAALQGASERLAPILMTATVTALGLLPMAIGSETAGHEIEGPMAMVILGGLTTSTLLNLLLLPTLALKYGRFQADRPPGV